MARWQKREDFLPSQTGALASTLRWEVTREFPIEAIMLRVRLNITGASSAAFTAGFPWTIFKRIMVTVADGSRTRNIVDVTGLGLAEYLMQVCGTLPSCNGLGGFAQGATNTVYEITLPIFFGLPNLSDPISSCLLLPAPRYNSNVILQVTTADALTDLVSNSPTVTWTMTPHIIRRDVRDPNWVYLDAELTELQLSAMPNSSANNMWELQIPGSYTGILLRGFNSLVTGLAAGNGFNGRGDPSASDINTSVSMTYGEFSLRLLGNVIRRFNWATCAQTNELSLAEPGYVGSVWAYPGVHARAGIVPAVYLDFLNDKFGQEADHLGSVLDTNPLMATGARLQLYADNKAASGTQYLSLVSHRIFGDLSSFKPTNSTAA